MSYNAKVYRKQGGDDLVVSSGGRVLVESGGSIEVEGTTYVVTEPDDTTLEVAADVLQVKDAGIDLAKLASEVTDLLALLSAIPTADAEDGETIWNDGGVLKVSSSGV